MKKCPRCMRHDSNDTRFCKHCGTELFFLERFEVDEKASAEKPLKTAFKAFFKGGKKKKNPKV